MSKTEQFLKELKGNQRFAQRFMTDPSGVLSQLGLFIGETPKALEMMDPSGVQTVMAGCSGGKRDMEV